jgi:hypothetical protein
MANSYKRACKNEKFKFEKQFTVFINHFPKIKEAFMVKPKMIFIDHYFCPNQTPKNAENVFQKIFYAKTNGALVKF